MDELRANAEAGATGLEEIFLELTGENAARALSMSSMPDAGDACIAVDSCPIRRRCTC